MIADILVLLESVPFQPFSIVTSSDMKYRVASSDHAGLNPQKSRVLVWFDDGSHVTVAGLHIVAIEEEASTASRLA